MNAQRIRISIALCTFNGAPYLRDQLESIASQTRLPDELVVCDDRSTDDTTALVKSVASNMPFPVRLYCNEENAGSTKNFEKAVGLCVGDVIAFCDQDDVWHPDKLMRMEAAFVGLASVGAVFTDAEIVDEHLNPLGYCLWQSIGFGHAQQKYVTSGRGVEILLRHNFFYGATMAFRSAFKDLILPMAWGHDGWTALLIASVADLALIRDPLIKYRQHARQQVVGRAVKRRFRERLVMGKATNPKDYLAEIYIYRLAYQRLVTRASQVMLHNKKTFALLEGKMGHLIVRSKMPARRLWRLPVIIRELVALRYHRYSNGIYSAAKDFCL